MIHSLSSTRLDRRSFTKTISLGAMATVLNLPSLGSDTPREDKTPDENGAPGNSVRFGLISDVHQDIMHDAPERVGEFVEAMEEAKVDFICQLGDFCWPHPRNKLFLEQWNAFRGTQHHVLGNHDMDGGFSREQTVAFYGMPARHYSFDCKGVHFICLDGNDPGGKDAKGYPHFIDESQAKWLADDLAKVKYPSVLFSHQPLDHPVAGIENGPAIRMILESVNQQNKKGKVLACFSGHLHEDYASKINRIHYLQINSASYNWLGSAYRHKSYSDAIHKAHPAIKYTAPYKEPLWALVTIDLECGTLEIQGKKTEWVGPDPWELGAPKTVCDPKVTGPRISDRRISLKKSSPS